MCRCRFGASRSPFDFLKKAPYIGDMLRRLLQATVFIGLFGASLWWRADHDNTTLTEALESYWFFAAATCAFVTYLVFNAHFWRWEIFQLIFIAGGMAAGYTWTLTDPDIDPGAQRGVVIIFVVLGGLAAYGATLIVSRIIDRYRALSAPRAARDTPGQGLDGLPDSPRHRAESPEPFRRDQGRDE